MEFKSEKEEQEHLPDVAKDSVGFAYLSQERIIPASGTRKVTTRREYWAYTAFYAALIPFGITSYGAALMQYLINHAFPSGFLFWGGKTVSVDSFILNLNGILFAVQLVVLLVVGPYADYGNWGPWLLIVVYIITFAFMGMIRPSQWNSAAALYVIGNLAINLSNTFLWSQYPGIVRDLPEMIESERQVLAGAKSADEHAKKDSLERSRLYCWCTFVGSFIQLCALGVAVGIAYKTSADLIKSYQILIGYFGAICILATAPFFIVQSRRPGQALPDGNWLLAGPRQVVQGARQARHLKHVMLYLVAYFLLQDAYGTSGNVRGIQQNAVINYNTVELSGLGMAGFAGGGFGALFWMVIQQRWKISVRIMTIVGGAGTLLPNLWGVIGIYTNTIGFHHPWEFWLAAAYNFMDATWGVFYVTMITEVVPAPKIYLFMSLFNIMGKTSAFIGPFISSAIINDAHGNPNMAYWFLLAMGLVGFGVLCFVGPAQAKLDNAKYLEQEAEALYTVEQRLSAKENGDTAGVGNLSA